MREVTLTDAEQGRILLSVVGPDREGPWGELTPLLGTEWEGVVLAVSGESYSHALHGYATPLARELGPAPRHMFSRLPRRPPCALAGPCIGSSPDCYPNPRVPVCYALPDAALAVGTALVAVMAAWRAGRYVVRVEGDTFSVT